MAVQNPRDQVTVNHFSQLVNIDSRRRKFMTSRTKEQFSSGYVPWACSSPHPLYHLLRSAPHPALQPSTCLSHPCFPCPCPLTLQYTRAFTTSFWLITVLPVPLFFPTYLLWAFNRAPRASWPCLLADPVGESWSQSCLFCWEGKNAASPSSVK